MSDRERRKFDPDGNELPSRKGYMTWLPTTVKKVDPEKVEELQRQKALMERMRKSPREAGTG